MTSIALLPVDVCAEEESFIYSTNDALSLEDYMQRVVQFNEAVQGRLLGFNAARSQRMAEMGNFEPAFVVSGEYVDSQRDLTTQLEQTYGADLEQFDERNKIYSSGIEMLTPIGTRLRIGARAGELENNLPEIRDFNLDLGIPEFETSLEISLEQPLLKGMGFAANLASLRLAARQSEIAFQDYRRELMQVVAEAELAYWELYYAQEELKLTRESVALAETLLNDSQASFDAGRGSKLDVLEAEAGLALRRSRERESYQKRVESMNRLAAFFGGVPRQNLVGYNAVDAPVSRPVEMSFESGLRTAMAMNPDLLRAQLQKEQEKIRLGYAKNQRLPELNLTAGFGSTAVDNKWRDSAKSVQDMTYPAWNVGLVLRLPIWGDVRGRNELRAARLRLMQIEKNESNLVTQLRSGRDTAEQRVNSSFTTARSLESVVEFRVNLLETRMESRDIGRMDTRSVLESEQELFVARLEQLQSEIAYQRALLELQMITGSLLQLRGLETSFADLDYRTREWVKGGGDKTPGLTYSIPQFDRLPREEPMHFNGDNVKAPWLGVDWGSWHFDNSYATPLIYEYEKSETEASEGRSNPRRFDGSHIR